MNASLAPALLITLGHEGGYVNHPSDPGGETFRGITRRSHPEWPGWKIIDAAKAQPGFPRSLDGDIDLGALVAQTYRDRYWAPIHGDHIPDQGIANELFDSAVNAGVTRATAWLQESLDVLNRGGWVDLVVDGIMGQATLDALSACVRAGDAGSLLLMMNIRQGDHYFRLASRNTAMRAFVRGWLKRVELRRKTS